MIRVRERLIAAQHFGRTWHKADMPVAASDAIVRC